MEFFSTKKLMLPPTIRDMRVRIKVCKYKVNCNILFRIHAGRHRTQSLTWTSPLWVCWRKLEVWHNAKFVKYPHKGFNKHVLPISLMQIAENVQLSYICHSWKLLPDCCWLRLGALFWIGFQSIVYWFMFRCIDTFSN